MNRRDFMLVAGAFLASPAFAVGEIDARGKEFKPWKEIGPFSQDAKGVFFMLDWSCQFCRQYFDPVTTWGWSLPRSLIYMNVPLIFEGDKSSIHMAMIYQAAEMSHSKAMVLALGKSLFEAKEEGGAELTPQRLVRRAVDLGFDYDKLMVAIKSQEIQKRITQTQRIGMRYAPDVTPTTVLGGRYAVTPDHAMGKMDVYISLLSGIVSQKMGVSKG